MPRALLALGANQGDPRATFAAALDALLKRADIHERARSAWRETRPIGGTDTRSLFLNGACLVETALEPHALWERMRAIEARFGRRRDVPWGPRTLDLDLLLYDQDVIHDAVLTLPHPRMALRRFVLEPAAEVAAGMLHPTLGVTIGDVWEHVRSTAPTARIAGGAAQDRRRLLELLELTLVRGPHAPAAWQVSLTPRATPPRIVIQLTTLVGDASDKLRGAEVRWADGLVLAVDSGELDAAAKEAALAIQGLGEADDS